MSVVSISHRLRTIEARRNASDAEAAALFVWGRNEADVDRALSALDASPSRVVRILWPFRDEPPAARWTPVNGLSDREIEAMILADGSDEPDLASHRRAVVMSDAELGNAIITSLAGKPTLGLSR